MLLRLVSLIAGLLIGTSAVHAGPYAPAAGVSGSTAVSKDDSRIQGWASGYLDYEPGTNVDASWKTPERALGAAVGDSFDIVGLGDHGRITLTFDGRLFNGPGADFAVFENGFGDTFLELAWVEVSSNGTDFFRFPNFSFTSSPVSSFGSIDPTNIDGLAGKYRQGYGTPFDLQVLASVPGLDVNDVRYVRIIDIVGDGTARDSLGNVIFDPYPTTGSGGFDLEAVAALHLAPVPEPESYVLMVLGLVLVGLFARRRQSKALSSHRRRGASAAGTLALGSMLAVANVNAATTVSTFDALPLAPNSYFAPGMSTTFTSGGGTFQHYFTDFGGGCCWSGWVYSNTTDTTTPGFTNQTSAFTGGGLASANYGIAFAGDAAPTITFSTPVIVSTGYFTNTTYAALSMLQGDGFAKKFGGASGTDPDFLKLTVLGRDAADVQTGSVDFYLADYRFENSADDYVVNQWRALDLSSLGAVSKLAFSMSSSDNGPFGMNTPAYFALDDLSVTPVPEPETFALMLVGLGLIGAAARRQRG